MKLSQFNAIFQDAAARRMDDPEVFVRLRYDSFFVALPFNAADYTNVFIDLGNPVERSVALPNNEE